MKYTVTSQETHEFKIPRNSDLNDVIVAEINNKTINLRILEKAADGSIRLVMVNNRVIPVKIERRADGFPDRVILNSIPYPLEIEKVESTRFKPPVQIREASGEVRAELPGQVTSIFVAVGEKVEIGQSLGILEAMKMENEITSPRSGIVKEIPAQTGSAVMKGDLILLIE